MNLLKWVKNFVGAMENAGFQAKIYDLDYWIFENKCVGSEIKYRSDKIVEEPVGVPSKANPDPAGEGKTFPVHILQRAINLE